MPEIKIPKYVSKWFREQGVDKLPTFIPISFNVPLPIRPDWAKGDIKYILIPATAGNVEYNITPNEKNRRWMILDLQLIFVADATVADRKVNIEPQNLAGDKIGHGFQNTNAFTASATRRIGLTRDFTRLVDVTMVTVNALGEGTWIIQKEEKINISVTAGVAGDSYSGWIRVIEVEI